MLEGEPTCLHDGTLFTFIGAKIWCPVCNSEGVIGSVGPHRPAFMMSKQEALDGDICLCKCSPPPVIHASQNDCFHNSDDAAAVVASMQTSLPVSASPSGEIYDEQVQVIDKITEKPIPNLSYFIKTQSGTVYSGYTNDEGLCERIVTSEPEELFVWLGKDAENQIGRL